MTKNETNSTNNNNDDDDSFVEVMEVDATPISSKETPALNLQLTPKHDVIGSKNKTTTTQVCATLKAIELPDDDDSKRAPVDIIVALDVSGSMMGEKLDLCKKTLELLIRQLLPQDRFGLVTFADEAIVEITTSNLTDSSKQESLTKIKALHTRGCTNISGAIGLAAQEMLAIKASPNEVRSIFLLTDGLANRGITAAADIVDLTKGCLTPRGKDDGTAPITIHCFGYGTDHDDSLLTRVSEATTGGTYYFVENDSNVATAFGDALGGLLSVTAQNATLNITVATGSDKFGVSIIDVHHENKTRKRDGSYSVNVGDFYAEESRDVLIDIGLAKVSSSNLANTTPIPHVEVSLSYMDTIKKTLTSTGSVVCNISRPMGSEISAPDEHVTVQWLRVHTANEINRADEMSRLGNLTQARLIIQVCKDEIMKETSLQSHPLVEQLKKDLDDVLGGLTSQQVYEVRGTKLCKMKRQAHRTQRCSAPTMEEANYYRSTKKAAMTMRFSSQNP